MNVFVFGKYLYIHVGTPLEIEFAEKPYCAESSKWVAFVDNEIQKACVGIDFMGPFPVSFGFVYILLVVDYVSKWVEAKPTRTNDAKVVVDFVRSNMFCRF